MSFAVFCFLFSRQDNIKWHDNIFLKIIKEIMWKSVITGSLLTNESSTLQHYTEYVHFVIHTNPFEYFPRRILLKKKITQRNLCILKNIISAKRITISLFHVNVRFVEEAIQRTLAANGWNEDKMRKTRSTFGPMRLIKVIRRHTTNVRQPKKVAESVRVVIHTRMVIQNMELEIT